MILSFEHHDDDGPRFSFPSDGSLRLAADREYNGRQTGQLPVGALVRVRYILMDRRKADPPQGPVWSEDLVLSEASEVPSQGLHAHVFGRRFVFNPTLFYYLLDAWPVRALKSSRHGPFRCTPQPETRAHRNSLSKIVREGLI